MDTSNGRLRRREMWKDGSVLGMERNARNYAHAFKLPGDEMRATNLPITVHVRYTLIISLV